MPAEPRPFALLVDLDRSAPDPPYDYPDYVGTRLRAPKEPLVVIRETLTKLSGPAYGESVIGELDADLARQFAEGPVLEKGITPMRSFVTEPMRHGRCS